MAIECSTASSTCPPLTIGVDLSPGEAHAESQFKALPARAGVLAIEDESGSTLALITTANLRRAAIGRLGPMPAEQTRSRRADLRPIARRILATTVGSAFEVDWAYLQLARRRLPHSYRSLLDRGQAWFVQCDPAQRFPQWVKTSHPGAAPTGKAGVYVGPFGDKHAAHRFIEMLEDAFDLCRYHHILVQAPRGSACAYKEMGRCPAPCDGSVSMADYHGQIMEATAFARASAHYRGQVEARMQRSSEALDFEAAQRCKVIMDRTALATRQEFAHVRELREFRFLAVLPAERKGWARLMFIDGGRVEPVVDVAAQAGPAIADLVEKWRAMPARGGGLPSEEEIENIGVVCRHLLMPRSQAKQRRAEFLQIPQGLSDATYVAKAIDRIASRTPTEDDAQPTLVEHELEGA